MSWWQLCYHWCQNDNLCWHQWWQSWHHKNCWFQWTGLTKKICFHDYFLNSKTLTVSWDQWVAAFFETLGLYCICHEVFTWFSRFVYLNTFGAETNGHHFDTTFKLIFLNDNCGILIPISLKFVPKGPVHNNTALVQVMAWCQIGDKPLSEPKMVFHLLMLRCVTQSIWVKVKFLVDWRDIFFTHVFQKCFNGTGAVIYWVIICWSAKKLTLKNIDKITPPICR